MPAISVIVPVYNAEKYLHRCIDSILAQSFTDFELLLINDGSRDKSGKICDEYALKDSRIRVFHKENEGASSARNLGLDNICGEWITFVDSDDWIDAELYEKMLVSALTTDSDIVVCGVKIEDDDKCLSRLECPQSYASKASLSNLHMIEGPIYSSLWNKLIKKSLFKNYNIRFEPRLRMWDDLYVILRIRYFNPKINVIENIYYHYIMTDSPSITKSGMSSKVSSQLLCASLLSTFLKSHKMQQRYLVLSNWLKFHAKAALFDKGYYNDWKQLVPETHQYIWQFKPYYGILRVMQYYMVIYGGFLGVSLLRLYKVIKQNLIEKLCLY